VIYRCQAGMQIRRRGNGHAVAPIGGTIAVHRIRRAAAPPSAGRAPWERSSRCSRRYRAGPPSGLPKAWAPLATLSRRGVRPGACARVRPRTPCQTTT
jgi:hypothetical protein